MSTEKQDDGAELAKRLATEKWSVVGVVAEGDIICVGGINLWDHIWQALEASVELPHPSYPSQRHRMDIYRIEVQGRQITFAAGELSANVWGFYLPASW